MGSPLGSAGSFPRGDSRWCDQARTGTIVVMETPPPDNSDQDPTEPVAATPPPQPPPQPRRLTRSRTDRILGGVGGGLAEHLGVDPLLVRFGIGLLVVLTGGAALLLYVAAWLLVPDAPLPAGQTVPPPRSRAASIGGVAALILLACIIVPSGIVVGWLAVPFAILALVGLGVWWLVMGIPADRTGRGVFVGILLGITILVVSGLLFFAGVAGVAGGGAAVVAAIVIGAGLTLAASAFVRPLRWLIVPALALGLGAGTAVAAGVEDVGGSTGEKVYRPVSASSILPHYELGAGHLVVDLRNAELTGEHRVDVEIGAGHAEILVPEGTCVAGDLHAGIGGFDVFGHGSGGIDVDHFEDGRAPAGTPRVVVTGDVGLGALTIDHEPSDDWDDDWNDNDWRDHDRNDTGTNACIGDPGVQG
jgi:phage shock protein PspC (stress-responsive transcriptional regulator)